MAAHPPPTSADCLSDLRQRIRKLERPAARKAATLPFGIAALDRHLPDAGLAFGTLHEIAGGGADAVQAAAAGHFIAGLAARSEGQVLWCAASADLFAPGLASAGLHPDRVLHASAPDEKTVLLVMEEALRDGSLAIVVGELARLGMTASRRLKLAAERSGAMALVLRRRREGQAEEQTLTASTTRWRISPLPSADMASPGLEHHPTVRDHPSDKDARQNKGLERYPTRLSDSIRSDNALGRARWLVELTRCRGGTQASWIMEACDAENSLALVADLADRPAAPNRGGQKRNVA